LERLAAVAHDQIGNVSVTITAQDSSSRRTNTVNTSRTIEHQPAIYPVLKEHKVDPMWSADEDERRAAIFRRAAAGARKTLRGQ
jgi:hypothetical protein